jgi:hypothetical protein
MRPVPSKLVTLATQVGGEDDTDESEFDDLPF